jgi:microcystin-dependent protein
MSVTPNMLLTLPDPTVTPGPEWAYLINLVLQSIDDHDHTPDKGKKVPVSAVDINQDLDMGNQTVLNTKALNLQNLSSALSGALNANKLQVINGNIWFTNAGGVPVQITSGNSIVSNIVVPSSPLMPSGTVLDFAGAVAPVGFLLCDGSAVSRSTYSDLFAAIGTVWGVGDGATTFNLPNLNGRTTIGSGTYTDLVDGSVSRSFAQTIGAASHILTTPQIPSHTHIQDAHSHVTTLVARVGDNSGGAAVWGGGDTTVLGATSNPTNSVVATNQSTGGGLSHNNMQPSVVVLKMIKT